MGLARGGSVASNGARENDGTIMALRSNGESSVLSPTMDSRAVMRRVEIY
jgi:hypothetical protein